MHHRLHLYHSMYRLLFIVSQFTIYLAGMDGLQVGLYLFFTGLNPLQETLCCILGTEEQRPTY